MKLTLLRRGYWLSVFIATVLLAVRAFCAETPAQTDAPTRKFIAANGLFQRNLYKLAADEYEDFLRQYAQHPNSTMARYALAVCRLRLSEYDKAAAGFERVLQDEKFAQAEDALFMLGHANLGLRQYDKAALAFERLLKDFPRGVRAESAALNRAQALYLAGKAQEAADACRQFLNSYPTSPQRPEGLYFLGLAQHAAGHDAQAIDALRKMLAAQPDSARKWDAILLLGQMLEAAKDFEAAAAEYRKLIDSNIADRVAEGLLSLGVLQYRRGAYDDSIKTLSRLLAEHAGSVNAPAARLQLALAQIAAGNLPDARATLAIIVAKDSARATTARYWLAQCDIIEKKFNQALAALDELSKTASANADRIAIDRAQCLMGLGRYSDAATAYAEFLDKYPAHAQAAEAMFYQAFCLHKSQEYQKSETICRRLLADPSGRFANNARELLAENLFLLARYDQARAVFQQLQAAGIGEKLRLTVRLGQCFYFEGKGDRAIELLSPVASEPKLLADRELARSLLLLGDALLNAGKVKEAAAVLARFVPIADADKAEAQFKLALAQLRGGEDVAAERTFMEVMRDKADSIWKTRATFEYGQLAYRNHEPAKAADALKTVAALKDHPELSGAAEYLLAWIELDAHRFEAAAPPHWAQAHKYNPAAPGHHTVI
jgi:TolA-binding protein